MQEYKSAITIDVEDGISIAMRDAFSVQSNQTDRVVDLTRKIIDFLCHNNVKATFFVLGQVAEKFPELIRKIADDGHELGVHGYNHLQFFRMTPQKAFDELSRAKKLIEDISGYEVYGHRAPAFSITPETAWGLDIIAKTGFVYDTSVMPIKGIRYGWPGFRKDIHQITTTGGSQIVEVPMSTIKILWKEIPVCGGGYLRIFPYSITRSAFRKIKKKRPAIIYLHPYELDTEKYPDYYLKELRKTNFTNRWKMKSMWINRRSMYGKMEKIISDGVFDKMINIVNNNLGK